MALHIACTALLFVLKRKVTNFSECTLISIYSKRILMYTKCSQFYSQETPHNLIIQNIYINHILTL